MIVIHLLLLQNSRFRIKAPKIGGILTRPSGAGRQPHPLPPQAHQHPPGTPPMHSTAHSYQQTNIHQPQQQHPSHRHHRPNAPTGSPSRPQKKGNHPRVPGRAEPVLRSQLSGQELTVNPSQVSYTCCVHMHQCVFEQACVHVLWILLLILLSFMYTPTFFFPLQSVVDGRGKERVEMLEAMCAYCGDKMESYLSECTATDIVISVVCWYNCMYLCSYYVCVCVYMCMACLHSTCTYECDIYVKAI